MGFGYQLTGSVRPAAATVAAEIMTWLCETVMRPHPALGRKGAICPYLDQATSRGRVSLNVIVIETANDFARLQTVVASWLPRISGAGQNSAEYESALFLPVGANHATLVDGVSRVQQQLRTQAILGGRMVGEFFPDHPAPGVHNPGFRPLDSPWPILGIRTMVDIDILFLSQPSIPLADRKEYLAAWRRFFLAHSRQAMRDVYEHAIASLGSEPSLEP